MPARPAPFALLGLCLLLGGCGPLGEDGWFVGLYGYVVDEARAPVAGATVTFAATDPTNGDLLPVGVATTDEDGRWDLPVFGTDLVGNALEASIEADGLASGVARWEVNLRAPVEANLQAGPYETWQTTDRRLATVRLAEEATTGAVEGVLLDAITGAPVPGVPLQLQAGANADLGATAATETVSDGDGRFSFSVYPAGAYTVVAAAAGAYTHARFPVFLSGNVQSAVGLLSPPVAPGLLRASLVWGPGVADLDLHLSAPRIGGTAGADQNGQYHVWSGNAFHPVNDPEGDGPEATMERLDADGAGPETAAIYLAPGAGDIYLWAFNNDAPVDDATASTALAQSDATIQVWFGEDTPRYYEIDPNEIATVWSPVVIDDVALVQYAVEQYGSGTVASDPEPF